MVTSIVGNRWLLGLATAGLWGSCGGCWLPGLAWLLQLGL